jgi:hypothetical protein
VRERECERVKKSWVYEREGYPKGCHKINVKISLLNIHLKTRFSQSNILKIYQMLKLVVL